MTEDQIKHMVDLFLMWKLPENFNPDNGISFSPIAGEGGPHPFRREPSGTNLFDATQATAMVRHMIEGLPPSSADIEEENRRLRERLGPRGLEVVMIDGAGHYVNEKVKAEIERLRSALQGILSAAEDGDEMAAISLAEAALEPRK